MYDVCLIMTSNVKSAVLNFKCKLIICDIRYCPYKEYEMENPHVICNLHIWKA